MDPVGPDDGRAARDLYSAAPVYAGVLEAVARPRGRFVVLEVASSKDATPWRLCGIASSSKPADTPWHVLEDDGHLSASRNTMHLDELRDHCLVKVGVTEEFPFDNSTLVFKVAGKMFALMSLERLPPSVNLKCDPERAVELREQYDDIEPGYHMSKTHWNTVGLQGDVPSDLIRDLTDHSYDLVVSKLTRAARATLQ